MKSYFPLFLILSFLFSCKNTPPAGKTYHGQLTTSVDEIVQPYLDSAQIAGVSIAVAKGDEIIFKKAYGYADLEFKVPTPSDASYEIGSVTKQFTAAAMLQLQEEGKLSLQNDISQYLPDFDIGDRKISLARLLDHTSGIKSYTAAEFFGDIYMQKLPQDTMLSFLEKEPFDFEPGEALIYNNSAFFILGLIIEKVSEMSYAEYVEKHLFEPAGMNNSYYCSESAVIHHRAHGYSPGREGKLQRAGYLDHIWPYAAGSLCSTVEDMIKWNRALHRDKIILSGESYEQIITSAPLNDGTPIRYTKGLVVGDVGGHKMIVHGGGIPGFLSDSRYYPDDEITIITLINTAGPVSPANISQKIAQQLMEFQPLEAVELDIDANALTGVYEGRGRGRNLRVEVGISDQQLTIKYGENRTDTLEYVGNDRWERETDGSFNEYALFKKNNDVYNELRIDGGSSHYVLSKERMKDNE